MSLSLFALVKSHIAILYLDKKQRYIRR